MAYIKIELPNKQPIIAQKRFARLKGEEKACVNCGFCIYVCIYIPKTFINAILLFDM